ncbi:TIM-barrel domain-containing protein [Thomasclavelia cocleata]|uniref:TIM-barrel domain-containing protein n=1 Tax=Thomasclavelia cocleata TaxID=69824 RepID=UPI00242C51BD|nr:TIM-barrel domain-containing protein [Thomasclavelia cocleata]MCI9629393.1 DUF5110 domain-containing protein [Thomasclavelia cocleata]
MASPNPFYFSTNGYGVLRHTFQPGEYDFHSTATMEHQEDRFDAYYFVEDSSKDILSDFVELTGNPMFMPKYAFYQGNADCYNLNGETLLNEGINRANQYNDNDMPVGWFLPNDGYGCGYGGLDNLGSFVEEAAKKGFKTGLWTEQDLDKLDKEVQSGTQMIKTDVAWVGEGYSFGLNAVRQAFEGIENNSDKRAFVFTVDGWAGTQRYAGLWSGDQTGGNWEYIRFHIPTYIGSGLSGNPNVGSDLDGIYGSNNVISTRDFQWKSFTPIMINMDGWTTGAEKNPWYHGEPYTSINRMYLKMKTGLMPYYYTYAKEAHDDGVPMVRAMMLEYPDDPYTWTNQTQYQYMWGENLLVAPVYNEADNNAEVRNNIYLPGGEDQVWIDYFTGEQYTGGKVINNFSAPLWKLPLFVKNGAILPKTPENNSQLEVTGDEDRIFEVYPSGNTEFEMYDDDGETQEYKEGKGTTTLITSKAPKTGTGTATITVNPAKGSFTGMKTARGTQFIVNVLKEPTALSATINNQEVALRKVNTQEEFDNARDNVYFYNENPNLNHYATPGSDFESVEIITNPKVQVKIVKDGRDITKDTVKLTVEGFNNTQEDIVNDNDPDLSNVEVPVLMATSDDNSITLNWDSVEGQMFDLEIDGTDGQPGMVYHKVSAPFVHEALNANEEHTYRLRLFNSKSVSEWGQWQRFSTTEDRYKNVIRDVIGTASSEIGGYNASQAVDGDLSTLWYTDWNDPVANNGDKIYTIDLQMAYKLDQLEYYNDGTAQIKNHEIQVSRDGINYKTVEASTWSRDPSGTFDKFVDLNGEIARYVRIVSHDLRHNSANEFRVYKVDGTEGFSEADVSTDGALGEPDLTFMKNYMGVNMADDLATFNQAVTGDINYNNEIDAYDLMFVTSKIAGLESTGRKAAGEITFTTDKKTVKAGEDVEVSIYGNNFKDINAFGLRFALDPDIYEFNGTNPVEASEQTKSMYNSSRTLRGDKGLYVALSNNGESKSLQGDMLLATFKMKAKIDTEVSLQPENVIVVSSGFDIRSAFGFEKQPADIKLLEDAVFAIKEINKKLYNEESVKVLTEALNEAQNVLNNTDISQENVNEAFVNLVSKLDKLERITQPNNEVLAELIEIVTSDGIQNNIETRELENFFINYVDPARNALQSGISAIGINEYIKTITEAFLQLHDKNGSIEYVNNVYLQYTNDLVSKLENKYTAESLTALNNAVTTKDINLIKNAVLNLEKVAVLDKDILAAVIEIAQGINETDYNSEDVKQLKDILTTAQKLFTDLDATQESIDQMVKKLSNHLIGLYDKDVMDLIKIRKQLSKLVDEITNLDLSIYTETSSKAIIAPLNEAKVLLENNESTFEDLDKAYLALLAAKNGLVEKVDSDKTKLNELIERADKIDLSFYTKESAESFVTVLKQAKLIMADETVTQKVVDEGVENLQNAIDSLIKLSDSQTSDESFKPGDSVDTSDNLDYRTAGLLMLLCGIIITATRRKKQDI